jgi:exonuclease-1
LNQYSLSFIKKTKKDICGNNKLLNTSEMIVPDLGDGATHTESLSTAPRTRNKFATFLMRKNKESGAIVVPGTRSRYSYIFRMFFVVLCTLLILNFVLN